jgi:hypothetical protein
MKNTIGIYGAGCILVLPWGSARAAGEQTGRPGSDSALVEAIPAPHDKALRNPLKGFTTRGIYDHEWATLAQTYIKWNEIENHESDGIDKIRRVTTVTVEIPKSCWILPAWRANRHRLAQAVCWPWSFFGKAGFRLVGLLNLPIRALRRSWSFPPNAKWRFIVPEMIRRKIVTQPPG